MRWRDRLWDVLDDLEQQAEGLALAARDAEVAEQSRAEYARVDLSARLHGSLGRRLTLGVRGVDAVLLPAAELDVAQLTGLEEGPDLRHRGGEDLRDVRERQEASARSVLGARSGGLRHGVTMPSFAVVSRRPPVFGCGHHP